jgi:hypothetical protein
VQYPLPGQAVGLIGEHAGGPARDLAQFGRQRSFEERADFVAKRQIAGGQVQIHPRSRQSAGKP